MYENSSLLIDLFLQHTPCVSVRDIQSHLASHNLNVSITTIRKYLKKLNYTFKKAIHKTKKTWSEEKIKQFELDMIEKLKVFGTIISIDECYFSEKVLPLNGYSKRGTRVVTTLSKSSWKAKSLLMAMSNKGEIWYNIIDGSVTGKQFEDFISLLPKESMIILDNAAIHRTKVDERKHFIPPYSPEYNPIENIFSKAKGIFRKLNASHSDVSRNIKKSIDQITTNDVKNCFQHLENELCKST